MSLFSSFGAQQQQKPLFGTSSTTPAQQTQPTTNPFGAFGQQQQQNQQQQQQQQPQPQLQQQQPSLFGGQTQSTGTGLFGNTANATNTTAGASQPSQPTINLFGSTNPQTQSQPQQQQQSTGLFGQPATSGLFGASTATSQPQQQQTGSLFGSTQPTQTNPFGGFGASTATTQQNQPAPSLFGQPAQSQQPQQSTAAPQFTRTTKFNDLPEDIRKKFEQIDTHIQGRVQISTELKQHRLGDEPQKGAEQIKVVHKDLVNSINKLRADIAAMRELRTRMDQAVQDTIAATRIIDAFKSGQSGQATQSQQVVWLKNYAGFPLEFFTRVTEQLRERLQWFNNTLEQIERRLVSEANHVSITPQSITSTLQAQHASFVALANKTAALDGELQKLKNTYRALWRAKTGSARDPFNELDRGALGGGEFGLEGLSVVA